MTQAKRAVFAELHRRPDLFLMPNAWDAGSAVILASLGFPAIATTSAGLAFSLGRGDGIGAVSRNDAIANARAIVEAVAVPVSADLENNYGDTPQECAETIRAAVAAGLAGGSIEDASGRQDDPIYDFGLAVERVRAAAEAARETGFVLTARAENFLHGRADLDDTIRRLQAFQEAGADVLFAPALGTLDRVRSVFGSIDRPLNVLAGPTLPIADLAALGVKRISVGGSFYRAAMGALQKAALELRDHGSFDLVANGPSHSALQSLFTQGCESA